MRFMWLMLAALTLATVACSSDSSDDKATTSSNAACGAAVESCSGDFSKTPSGVGVQGALIFADAQPHGTSLGSANAAVKVELWANFLCSHCRDFMYNVLPQIVDSYVESGDVSITFRNAAIGSEGSLIAHEAAACANDQGKFWPALDALYHNFSGDASDYASDKISSRLDGSGADATALATCLSGEKHKAEIQADVAEMDAMNRPALPVLMVNGQSYPGPEMFSDVKIILDRALGR